MQKNIILKSTAVLMALLFVVASFLPDETGWMGFVLTIVPFSWLMIFDFANDRGDYDGKHHTE